MNNTILLSNSLTVLAAEIAKAHADVQTAAQTAAERALAAGDLLVEAQRLVQHGGWLPWLKATGIPERSARRYMALHRGGLKAAIVADLGFVCAEKFATAGLKMLPKGGCAVQAIGRDDDGGGAISFWWPEPDGFAGYWHCAVFRAESFCVTPGRPVPPWLLGLLHERETTRYDFYEEAEISIAEVHAFLAKFEADDAEVRV